MFKEIEIKHLWRFRVLEVGLAHGDFEAATCLDLVPDFLSGFGTVS